MRISMSKRNHVAILPTRRWGDGKCDLLCNSMQCDQDGGDCVQLYFDNPLSNCTYDLYTNDECDAECSNQYCQVYSWSSGFNLRPKVDWSNRGK